MVCGALLCSPVRAQTVGNVVRVYTQPPGVYFQVDGQSYIGAASFSWPANSKHVVTSYDQSQTVAGVVYVFKGWITNLSSTVGTNNEPITADPSLQWVELFFDTSYAVTIMLPDCPDSAQPCPGGGTVQVNGQSYDRRTQILLPQNATIEARAFPNSGYIFTGWAQVTGLGAVATAFDITFTLIGPTELTPLFQPANAAQVQTNIQTIPPTLQILVDGAPFTGTTALQWGWGTTHSLGANPVQQALGVTYVFDSWSDGGAINHNVVVPSQAGTLNFTANFVPASYVTFGTTPSGLSLSIDGRQNWPSYSFVWDPGATHQISAPATQTDAQGRTYQFVSWSNGQPAAFAYTVGPAPGGDIVTAVYQMVPAPGQATVTSVPVGLTVRVDGASCTTPCTLQKAVGASANVSVAAMQNVSAQSRLVFQGWGDSASLTRAIQFSSVPQTYTATYSLQNLLSISVTPPAGASVVVTPSSPDGFYDSQSVVTIAVTVALGFRVDSWSGALSGTSTGAMLSMASPQTAVLLLDPVPAIAPLGIQNAAFGGSANGLAGGSLISIFGGNLAPAVQVGPSSPLLQTLQNVTVRIDSSFLPLVFVSPQQINAQLPYAMAQGSHTVVVSWQGMPPASAPISVVRNAPGLFSSGTADQPIGAFVRSNGTPVTPNNPAHANDVVSVLGTGLGPYAAAPPDGYLFDESSGYKLVDPVVVVAGTTQITNILYAGRSTAGVGVDEVRFAVPASLPAAPFLAVKIQIDGQASNTVLLPISQ